MSDSFEVPTYLTSFEPQAVAHMFPDVLVIGSGVAGLRAALEAARHRVRVLLLTKGKLADSNSWHAQGGIAGALGDQDTWQRHRDDTLAAGHGLCDPEVVEAIVRHGPDRIDELLAWGADFDREDGRLALTREGGHSCNRVAHALGDATGKEIVRTLVDRVRNVDGLTVLEETFATDLLATDGVCHGAVVWHPTRGQMLIWTSAVVLATGGVGQVYRETTNPPMATGDGVAMAFRAGADLRDMEFIQFHPTMLYVAGGLRCLVSEAVRGEGAHLVDKDGTRFMPDRDPRAELAPRDIVARAITRQMTATHHPCVYLDLRHLPLERVYQRFPMIRGICAQFGLDIAKDLIPVRPGAHYTVGGVAIEKDGRTSLDRLWACGEVASSGLHGANRLGSNSLLEGLEFGMQMGRQVAARALENGRTMVVHEITNRRKPSDLSELDFADINNSLKSLMARQVGIDRHADGLRETLASIDFWSRYVLSQQFDSPKGWELQNMLIVARAITSAALMREESRGVHYRRDFPNRDDDHWQQHIRINRRQGAFREEAITAS